jgi:hypothetical protein
VLDELATECAGFVVDEGNVCIVVLKLGLNPIKLPICTLNQVRIEGSNRNIPQCIVLS